MQLINVFVQHPNEIVIVS